MRSGIECTDGAWCDPNTGPAATPPIPVGRIRPRHTLSITEFAHAYRRLTIQCTGRLLYTSGVSSVITLHTASVVFCAQLNGYMVTALPSASLALALTQRTETLMIPHCFSGSAVPSDSALGPGRQLRVEQIIGSQGPHSIYRAKISAEEDSIGDSQRVIIENRPQTRFSGAQSTFESYFDRSNTDKQALIM